jgi:hypothetical protein
MIALSAQDKFDGTNKVSELRAAIGKEFSDNFSSTCRSILLSVSPDGNTCVTKEVAAWGRVPKKGTRKAPSWMTWNAIYF